LSEAKPKLEQFAVNAWRAQSEFSVLICRIGPRNSISIRGRPPREFDFQRQQQRNFGDEDALSETAGGKQPTG
jgi:hypothetical protein